MSTKSHSKYNRKRTPILNTIRVLVIIGILIMLPIFLYECYKLKKAVDDYNSIPSVSNESATKNLPIITGSPDTWPKKTLFVEKHRSEYKSGNLRLIIPKLKLNEAIMDGTNKASLKHGPGLYEYSQMPGEGDRNVSIAGHRAGYSKYANIFRNIHKIRKGDLLYLMDDKYIYTYLFNKTKIVKPDDIRVLYLQGFSCLTLTSCNPIGQNYERIVVISKLKNIDKKKNDFKFQTKEE